MTLALVDSQYQNIRFVLEMAKHKDFTVATDVQVYFCYPQSPGDKGTFAPKVHIRSIELEDAFGEIKFAGHILSSGSLFLSRHSGYKVGHFVDVAFAGILADEKKGPSGELQ